MKQVKQIILFYMIYVATFFIDSVGSIYVKSLSNHYAPTIHLSLLFLFILTLYYTKLSYVIAGFGGLLYDFYFSPIPLFYTIPIVVLLFIVRKMIKKIDIIHFCIHFLIFILLYHLMLYSQSIVFNLSSYLFFDYVGYKVLPTLVVNVAIAIVVYGIVDAILHKNKRNFKL